MFVCVCPLAQQFDSPTAAGTMRTRTYISYNMSMRMRMRMYVMFCAI